MRTHRLTPRAYGLIGAAIAAAASGFELVRSLLQGGLPHFEPAGNIVLAVTFVAVNLLSAIGLATHRRFGYPAAVLGMLALLGYGAVIQSAANHDGRMHTPVGFAYMLLGIAMFVCLARSLAHYRETPFGATA